MPKDDIKVAAVALGADTRWSWRIFTHDGRILRESQDTFANVAAALADGRRRLPDVAAELQPAGPVEVPRAIERVDPPSTRIREAQRWF